MITATPLSLLLSFAAPDTTRITGDALEREIAFTLEDGSITQRRHDSLRELPCAEWQARREATLRAPTPK